MCEVVAKKMLVTLATCDVLKKSRSIFNRAAARNDCETTWRWYQHCVRNRPEVGRGLARGGLKLLEAVRPEMERLYAEHRKNVGATVTYRDHVDRGSLR